MQHNHPNPIKNQYDRCVFLVFNCQNEYWLNKTEELLLEATINKWKQHQDDPKGERIHIIFVNPRDFAPVERDNKSELLRRDRKYSSLTQLTSKSHLYLIGHHEINDNRLEVSDDGCNGEIPDKYEYFDVDEIAALLTKYLRHPSIQKHRELPLTAPKDSILEDRLKISIAMCNTAVGLLKNGERKVENSFAYQMAMRLYNQHPLFYVDCVVAGTKAWMYPLPGAPSLSKLLKLLVADVATIVNDDFYRETTHKRYMPNLSMFGKMHQLPVLLTGKRGQFKTYFAPSTKNTTDEIKERNVAIEVIDGTVWCKQREHRLNQAVEARHPSNTLKV